MNDPKPPTPSEAAPTPEVPEVAVLTRAPAGTEPRPGTRPPSAPRQPFTEPARAPDRAEEPDASATPDGPEADPTLEGSTDPQAQITTKELSLAALRAAATRSASEPSAEASPEPSSELSSEPSPAPDAEPAAGDSELDLVAAERQEAAELDAAELEAAALELGDLDPAALELAELDVTSDPTGSPIDPRIRERRVAVTRAEGRRRLRILLTAISVASLIGIGWLVVHSPFLAVDTVTVSGTAQESGTEVTKAADVAEGAPLLLVDTGAVARRVEALPWVAKARVDRELPNTLKITVVERLPVAFIRRPVPSGSPEGTVGAAVLVDRFGRVLGDVPQPPPGLPELVDVGRIPGRGGRIKAARAAAAIAELPPVLSRQTGSMRRDKGWVLTLVPVSGGAIPASDEVRLGNLDDVWAKGVAALAVLDQLTADGDGADYIDVQVPGAPATG